MGRAGSAAPPLVGRRSEVDWLSARLDDALAGRPQVVLVSGHAGIGKSRLVREIHHIAADRGADLCSGRCQEHLDLPYLPLAGSLLPRIEPIVSAEPSLRRYAHLVSRLLGRIDAPIEDGATPEQEQTWLFLAVAQATTLLAQQRPLVLSIDDLQWADRASLLLFTHVVLEISDVAVRTPVPLLVLATVRPDPDIAVATQIGRLARDEICHTLELGGLDEGETAELVRGLGLVNPTRRFVAALHRVSVGNPLLLENAVRQVERNGNAMEERDLGPEVVDLVALESSHVGQAVAPWLAELSADCRTALEGLACVARATTADEAAGVIGRPVRELNASMAQAVACGLVTHDAAGYQFAHPLYARVVYAGIPLIQRQQWHYAVATHLDALGPSHLLEVSHHLIDAGPAAPARLVFDRTRVGSERAEAMFAWADAARFAYAAATSARRLGQPTDVRADLHLRAGTAHLRNMDTEPARENLERAMELYRSAGDTRGYLRAATHHVRVQLVAGGYGASVDIAELDDAVAELGETDPALVSEVLSQVAEAFWLSGDVATATDRATRALDLGRAGENAPACARALVTLANIEWLRLNLHDSVDRFVEAREHARNANDAWLEANALSRLALTRLWLGDLDEAEATAEAAVEITVRTGNTVERSFALGALACVAAARGDFPAADRHGEAAWMAAQIGHYEWSPLLFMPALAAARSSRGFYAGADAAIDRLVPAGARDTSVDDNLQVLRLLVWSRAGRVDEVRDSALAHPDRVGGRWGVMLGAVARIAASVEIADTVDVDVDWNVFDRYLGRVADRGMVLVDGVNALVPRLRGIVARRLDDLERADSYLHDAVILCEESGLRAELGRVLLERARVAALDSPDEPARAIDLALRARAVLAQLGMDPFAAQAAELLAELRHETPRPEPSSVQVTRTETAIVAFADVAGSTELTERLGDLAFRTQAMALEADLRAAVAGCGGYAAEGVTLGDGVLAVFSSGVQAIEFADRAHDSARTIGLRLHVGINAGDVLRTATNAHGGTVNVAARICDLAAEGETLVAEIVRTLVRTSSPTAFVDRGVHELKGVREPHRLFAVVPTLSHP